MNGSKPTTIRLRDGRALAYDEHGTPQGWPLFFLQGTPSSRLMRPCIEATEEMGARIISADRPGFGFSDPKPGRTLLDWASDIAELADALGIEKFRLAGVSGGSPYAAACAYALPERVSAVAIIGGAGPVDSPEVLRGIALERRVGFWLARHTPSIFAAILRSSRNPARDLESFYRRYTRHNPAADRALLSQPAVKQMFLRSYAEAVRQGPQAFVDEVLLLANRWDFDISKIRVPVSIWHSNDDNSIPIGFGKELARRIPGARAHWFSDEGHLLFLGQRWRDVLEDLHPDAQGFSSTRDWA